MVMSRNVTLTLILSCFCILIFRVRVTLRLTVSQSVCLGVEPNLGLLTRDFFFLGAPSLTRGRVCHVSVLSFKSTVDPHIVVRPV
jgi:hypothetical protein